MEIATDFKIIIGWKKASDRKPLWEDASAQSCAIKTLCSQRDRQSALQAHHSHTTGSHRGVRKTLCAPQSYRRAPEVHRFAACRFVCG